jgi:hypothetical protein
MRQEALYARVRWATAGASDMQQEALYAMVRWVTAGASNMRHEALYAMVRWATASASDTWPRSRQRVAPASGTVRERRVYF